MELKASSFERGLVTWLSILQPASLDLDRLKDQFALFEAFPSCQLIAPMVTTHMGSLGRLRTSQCRWSLSDMFTVVKWRVTPQLNHLLGEACHV